MNEYKFSLNKKKMITCAYVFESYYEYLNI